MNIQFARLLSKCLDSISDFTHDSCDIEECHFSKLKLIKTFLRLVIHHQDRLSNLGIIFTENDIAESIDFPS